MEGSEKPTILVYGNCQGGAIRHCLRACPTVTEWYDIGNWENFPGDGHAHEIPQSFKDRCEIFIHQVGEWGRESPLHASLPGGALTVHFPPSASNAMFPLRDRWPDSVQHSPWPFRFHIDYSDRLAIELAGRVPDKATYLEEYGRIDIAEHYDLPRMHELDLMWIARNDAISDIAIADVLADKITRQRICWMPGHLSNPVIHVLMHRLIRRLGQDVPVPFRTQQRSIAAELRHILSADEFFGEMTVPIHQQVARILDLAWYDPQERYVHAEDGSWTHGEFIADLYDYVTGKPWDRK